MKTTDDSIIEYFVLNDNKNHSVNKQKIKYETYVKINKSKEI